MKFSKFTIKNFKGIDEITFDLNKSPNAKIYTLVGLNESGKTTILEALNFFSREIGSEKPHNAVNITNPINSDVYNSLVPVSKRDNFNDEISIEVVTTLDQDDHKEIERHAIANTSYRRIKKLSEISHCQKYIFKDSKFHATHHTWTGLEGILKASTKNKYESVNGEDDCDNITMYKFCESMTPGILYFPNFLFDFPSKIYLEFAAAPREKDKFYIELIQDILNSLKNDSNVNDHIIKRVKNVNDGFDKRNLDSLLQRMSNKITEVVFDSWNKIFKRSVSDTKVVVKCSLDENELAFLEFELQGIDGLYQINERSLGFRWYFIFLLFTQFRPFRKNTPQNIIYLFDEPASNLHPSAQKQLLASFENLTETSKIIYTTHSQHLINPSWLESTYVVKNEGQNFEDVVENTIRKTSIKIEPYREFVANHPKSTTFFQPILDVLDYSPSNLESIPSCIFTEGKNDFYTLQYFQDVIFKKYNLNISPGIGSSSLDTIITLYIGWQKDFLVLLDDDGEGKRQKRRYLDRFGKIVESKIFTLADIDPEWSDYQFEALFKNGDAFKFQQNSYPNIEKYHKIYFNRAMQECLANKTDFNFSEQTKNNIKKILKFLKEKV